MAVKKNEVILNIYEVPNIKKYWKTFLAVGILLIVLGLWAIGYANYATEVTVVLLGFFLAAAGILMIISSVYAIRWTGFSLSLLLGLLYIIAGGLCIFKPIQSAYAISLLVALLLLVGGLFRLVYGLTHRINQWGWVVFNGLLAILLGVLILSEWPASAVWVIGLFVGIDMLFAGWYWVILSLKAKKLLK